MPELIINPEQEALKSEMESLRTEFLRCYTEKDRLLSEDHDDLYVRYMDAVGRMKFENFQLEVEVRSLKLKVELAQAAVNRNERPNVAAIERQVSRDLRDYYRKIEAQAEELRAAKEVLLISEFDMQEMRDLFRTLAKRLHPDLHPAQPDHLADLFIQAQTAYRMHNLAKLREIVLRLDMDASADAGSLKGELPEETIARLKAQIQHLKQDIELIQSQFPFNLRSQLLDPAWVHEQQAAERKRREELERQKEMYEDRFSLIVN